MASVMEYIIVLCILYWIFPRFLSGLQTVLITHSGNYNSLRFSINGWFYQSVLYIIFLQIIESEDNVQRSLKCRQINLLVSLLRYQASTIHSTIHPSSYCLLFGVARATPFMLQRVVCRARAGTGAALCRMSGGC